MPKITAELLNSLMDEWFNNRMLGSTIKEFGAWLCEKLHFQDKELESTKSLHDALPLIYDKYLG